MLIVVRFSGSVKNPESARDSYGGVAQLGEHLPCKQGVKSSNLFISTTQRGSVKKDGHPKARDTDKDGLIAQQARARA